MNKMNLLAGSFLAMAFLSLNSYAFEIAAPVSESIKSYAIRKQAGPAQPEARAVIMGIKLTASERGNLANVQSQLQQSTLTNSMPTTSSILPSNSNLGMNNVPVLNQGQHGSCVTFAATAAIDAALGHGDYISQLCQLELGSTLEQNTYMYSGWEGTLGSWVLDQMLRYGVVSKTKQAMQSCAGIKEYPLMNDSFAPMTEADYKSMSESLIDQGVYSVPLLTVYERFNADEKYTLDDGTQLVNKLKNALSKGNRAVIGAILLYETSPNCFVGACAKYHTTNDTWAMTKELNFNSATGGHEMVIFGYDDNAVAIDSEGKPHRGLFMLRNSWTAGAGDQGNFYMTYDYFKTFIDEVHVIHKAKSE